MSYCRFSSLNYRSNVYVYANVHGAWIIMIASSRFPEAGPPCPWDTLSIDDLEDGEADARIDEMLSAQIRWLEQVKPAPLDHPDAGKVLEFSSPGACADRLEQLRGSGLVVPSRAVRELRADQSLYEQSAEA